MPGVLEKGDRVRFKRLAHRLAGSFALYGFHWAAAQCRGIEQDSPAAPVRELLARVVAVREHLAAAKVRFAKRPSEERSEEHTSELQSQSNLACRLLLETT